MAIARAIEHFRCVKGEDYQINWTIQTSDADTTPVDITGWAFEMKVKRRASTPDPSVITATLTLVTPTAGLMKAVFAAADTARLSGDYRFSLWRTDAGAASCLCTGFFSVVDTTQN